MDALAEADEKLLLDCVKQATELVDDGVVPNDAVEKVARARGLTPGAVETVSRAYNTGRQLGQWRANTGVLDKLASFPLAQAEEINRRLAAPVTKAASASTSLEYKLPPSWLPDRDAGERRELIKAAAANPPAPVPPPADPPDLAMRRSWARVEHAKKARDNARLELHVTRDQVQTTVLKLATYFSHPAGDRQPFATYELAARERCGNEGVALMNLVHAQSRCRDKRALSDDELAQLPPSKLPLAYKLAADYDTMPMADILHAVQLGRKSAQLAQKLAAAEQALVKVNEDVLGLFPEADGSQAGRSPLITASVGQKAASGGMLSDVGVIAAGDILGGLYLHNREQDERTAAAEPLEPSQLAADNARDEALAEIKRQSRLVRKPRRRSLIQPKMAFLGSAAVGGAVASALQRGLGEMPKTRGDLVEDAWLELEDPKHQDELRKIRLNANLSAMMTDPDDPISGHDPDRVLSAYNEISRTAPRLAENPTLLKPVLRRHLAGQVEPFEANELLNLEKGLNSTRTPGPMTKELTSAPASLFG